MSSFGTNTRKETFVPHCVIDHTLLQSSHAPACNAAIFTVHKSQEFSSGMSRFCISPKFCSQPDLDLDCCEPQVWWNESGCLPFQKADCLARLMYTLYRSTSCWKILSSLKIWSYA